ncbi:MAG: CCA tRNA nucleotidyltransferase, partial [Alphaproteobacteria bacterium]|nr:CCA tRNA nucleotidyltransferase [Alphaproteobacteria bacterium]
PRAAGALQWRMLLEMADNWQRPRFPLTGRDVMLAGVPEGPDVGRVLARVEDWWVASDFAADEGACREQLKAAIAKDGA